MAVRKLTEDRRLREKLVKKVVGNPITGPFWPLSLELVNLGKGKAEWLQEKIPAYLLVLHQKQASLLDWDAKPKVYKEAPDDLDDEPDYAIEDYGADYGSEDASNSEDHNDKIPTDERPASFKSMLDELFGTGNHSGNASKDDEPF